MVLIELNSNKLTRKPQGLIEKANLDKIGEVNCSKSIRIYFLEKEKAVLVLGTGPNLPP